MSTPIWFDSKYYMDGKLAALQQQDPSWTVESMWRAFYDANYTPYQHFVAHGDWENLNPNPLFDNDQYLRNKAAQMGMSGAEKLVGELIHAAGFTYAQHYDLYGSKEGINPSDQFDQSKYYQAKLYQMQATDKTYTLDRLVRAFDEANLTPMEHYLLYGISEGISEADANARGYSYAVNDNRPVTNPNKAGGFDYTLDHKSNTVRTITVEKILTEQDIDGAASYTLTTTTIDLTETTEITNITITGSATLDLSDVLAMLGK